jgi:flavin reductase (DIM6/NTAB) family NADH-FMN oxidoreductase RutF
LLATFAANSPKIDPTAVFSLSYGLFVLTVGGEKENGCISNTVFQISENPTRIAVSCQKGNLTRELIEKTGVFNISVLTEKVPFELVRHFGMQSGREVDKFAEFKDTAVSANGVRYINKYTNAFISAKVISATDMDSHMLFICDITESAVLGSDPSCTYAHYRNAVKPKN